MISKPTLPAFLPLMSLLMTISTAQTLEKYSPAYQPKPYTINVDPVFIEETRVKASKFHKTADIDAPAWFDGPPTSEISAIAEYWSEEYDWYKVQDGINKNFSHFYTTVPSPGGNYRSNEPVDLHFIHQRSEREDAIPILFLHGWPSTSLEWEKVILPLVNPGNESKPAFHVVAPDIPGFGFSPAAKAPGLGRAELGTVFSSLMAQLGYDRYALYSTDAGAILAMGMVVEHAEDIINHITDFYIVFPTDADTARFAANQTTSEEATYISAINSYLTSHSAYASIQSTYPLSLAYALNDSPVGFLAWQYQLTATVGDETYTPERLITDTLVLYINGVYGNIRLYKEIFNPAYFNPSVPFTVPTTILQFGSAGCYAELGNFNYVPRDWVERTANVTYFNRHEKGAHFPALSQPQLVIDDIQAALA